jgi:hypothetical protein
MPPYTRASITSVLPALVHAALDQKDSTFALLEDAYAAKDPVLISIQVGEIGGIVHLTDGRLAALRSDPRFGDLVRKMGLVPRVPMP